jgi:hypothetical protein
MLAVLIIEDKVLLPADTEPVEQLKASLHQNQVVSSYIAIVLEMEIGPEYADDLNDQVNTSLQGLDPCELRYLALSVEMFDPAPQVLEHGQEVIYVNVRGSQRLNVVEFVHEGNDLWQVDQLWDLQPLLFK